MNTPEIKKRLRQLEIEIAEVTQRLPAHSVKPTIMQDLFALEDEKELLQKQLARIINQDENDHIPGI